MLKCKCIFSLPETYETLFVQQTGKEWPFDMVHGMFHEGLRFPSRPMKGDEIFIDIPYGPLQCTVEQVEFQFSQRPDEEGACVLHIDVCESTPEEYVGAMLEECVKFGCV